LFPDLLELKAIHFPSGEKCGLLSTAGVLVILTVFSLPRSVTHISPPYVKDICVELIVGWRNSLVPWQKITLAVTQKHIIMDIHFDFARFSMQMVFNPVIRDGLIDFVFIL
jgi:hypothetical protein